MSEELFVARPQPVRAVQWRAVGDARRFGTRVMEFGGDDEDTRRFILSGTGTTHGELVGLPGDWIVEMPDGALRRMTDETFRSTYQPWNDGLGFMLQPTDPLAPDTIRVWVDRARISGVPEHKIRSAQDMIEKIERWAGPRHYPD